RKYKYNFYTLADPAMPFVALGLGFGRIGNFINGELWGKVTTVPWAVIFPNGGYLPRHPSQLYEALLEGFLMAIFLQIVLLKTKLKGLVFWLFIGTYGVVRFLLEFIRVPDENVDIYDSGLIWNAFTMGQVLSLFMIVACLCFFALLFFKYRRAK
ncbi:MAG: prolipoprotein diacylglyceryl transferase, partial [Candidatus Cloacimonetes bacterium]|nr:prolipoprotein diacylglyceryl transferase [Candidatus Cloacimonadota bacterium]